ASLSQPPWVRRTSPARTSGYEAPSRISWPANMGSLMPPRRPGREGPWSLSGRRSSWHHVTPRSQRGGGLPHPGRVITVGRPAFPRSTAGSSLAAHVHGPLARAHDTGRIVSLFTKCRWPRRFRGQPGARRGTTGGCTWAGAHDGGAG